MDAWGRYIVSIVLDLLTEYMTEKEIIRALKEDFDLGAEDILDLNY